MRRAILSALSIGLLVALEPALEAQGDRPILTVLTRVPFVFLAKIVSATPHPAADPRERRVAVRVLVTRVLKKPSGGPELPLEFDFDIPQYGPTHTTQPYYWTGAEIQSGQEYLVASDNGALPVMIGAPGMAQLITNKASTVSDAEAILNAASLSLTEQASELASLLAVHSEPHSWLLADYAVAALQAGKDYEVSPLARAIEAIPSGTFSEDGMLHLLDRLHHASMVTGREDILRVAVSQVVRSFLIDDKEPRPGQEWAFPYSPFQDMAVKFYFPWIRSSERATALLRTAVPADLLRDVKRKATSLAIDPRSGQERRQQLSQLIELLGPEPER